MTEPARAFYEGDLYKLLNTRLTNICRTPRGQLSIGALADRMGYSSEGLYKYLRADKLAMKGAKALMEACDGLISEEDIRPFMPYQLKD